MAKKIRLVLILASVLFLALLLVVLGFFYYNHEKNLPVEKPTTKTSKVLQLNSLLKAANLSLENTPVEHNGTITASVSGNLVLFSTRKDLKTEIKALQLIIGKLKMDPVKPKEIDLRFSKVVVRY